MILNWLVQEESQASGTSETTKFILFVQKLLYARIKKVRIPINGYMSSEQTYIYIYINLLKFWFGMFSSNRIVYKNYVRENVYIIFKII